MAKQSLCVSTISKLPSPVFCSGHPGSSQEAMRLPQLQFTSSSAKGKRVIRSIATAHRCESTEDFCVEVHWSFDVWDRVHSYVGHERISYMNSPHLRLHLPSLCGTDLTQGTRDPSQDHSFEQSHQLGLHSPLPNQSWRFCRA